MTRCIFRQTKRHHGWRLLPLIIIFVSTVVTLEQQPKTQPHWEGNSNLATGIMLTSKN